MQNWFVPVTLISVTVGVLIAAQFKIQAAYREDMPSRRVEELVMMLKDAEAESVRLTTQVEAMRTQLKTADGSEDGSGTNRPEPPSRWAPLTGPGIELQIADSSKPLAKGENPNIAIVHNEDLLKIVNELRASGAEALAVNDQRLVETSEISCAGPTILVNKSRLVPPFSIRAIGDPETMMAALQLRGGVVEYLQFYGIQVTIAKKPDVQVPMYLGGNSYQFARPLGAKKSS